MVITGNIHAPNFLFPVNSIVTVVTGNNMVDGPDF